MFEVFTPQLKGSSSLPPYLSVRSASLCMSHRCTRWVVKEPLSKQRKVYISECFSTCYLCSVSGLFCIWLFFFASSSDQLHVHYSIWSRRTCLAHLKSHFYTCVVWEWIKSPEFLKTRQSVYFLFNCKLWKILRKFRFCCLFLLKRLLVVVLIFSLSFCLHLILQTKLHHYIILCVHV